MKPKATRGVVSIGAPGTVLLRDDFIDTDTTILSLHTVSPINHYNAAWVKDNTFDLTIVGNQLTSTGLDTTPEKENDHYIDLFVTDVTLEAQVQFSSGTGTSLIFLMSRYQDSSNHVLVLFQNIGGTLVNIEIRELTDNLHTVLASSLLDESYATASVNLKLKDDGSTLTAYLDGEEVCSAEYTRLNTQTRVGIKTQNDDCTIEYFEVTKT